MPTPSGRYTQRHFRDFAALLAAEREQNSPSPALNRILAAVTRLFAENSASFNRELFGHAARGNVPATTRPRRSPVSPPSVPHWAAGAAKSVRLLAQQQETGQEPSDRSEQRGWTPPVITQTEGPRS